MPYTDFVKNPNDAGNAIVSRGFRAYFRKHKPGGTVDSGTKFTWLGVTKNYEPNNDEQTRQFDANLYGVEETWKKVLAKRTRTFTFMTGSTASIDITNLFYGSEMVAGAGTWAAVSAIEDTGAASNGDAVLVFEADAGLSLVGYYPSVNLRGTGKGDEDGFETYEFEATLQSVSTFVPPAALVNMDGRTTPQGVLYLVDKDDLDEFLEALMDEVTTAPADPTPDV